MPCGLSCLAGLLTWLHLAQQAFPVSQWLNLLAIRLTALGTCRNCTGFPILLREQAPDMDDISGEQP